MKERIVETLKEALEPESDEDVITILKKDHKRVEGLCKEFDVSNSIVEQRTLLSKIIAELSAHSAAEERLVYPLLTHVEPEQTEESLQEHHVIKLVLKELSEMEPNEAQTRAKVKVLSEIVKHHVKEEEKEMLPELKKMDIDREELGRKVLKEKKTVLSRNNVEQMLESRQDQNDRNYIGQGTSPIESTGTAKNTGKIKGENVASPRDRSATARKIAGHSRALKKGTPSPTPRRRKAS